MTDTETREERLTREVAEYADLTGRLGRLLTLTANALKGDPPETVWHDWSDLPEVARELREEVDRLKNASVGDVGARIKQLREAQGMSLNELARRARVSASKLSYIERPREGKGGRPSFDVIERIFAALGEDVR